MDFPDEIKLPIIGIFGRYMHTFSVARMNHNLSLEASHLTAQNAVMGDPRVMAMIEQMLGQGVNGMIGRMVE